jgi:mono/diheme cytochrome c family protein
MRACFSVAVGLFIGAAAFAADPDSIARGKYLVDEVAKCSDCHTPRGADGKPDATKYLKGATLDFQPIAEMKGWHKASPDLTSASRLWERWGVDGFVTFLETGVNPRGNPAGPPMPAYKLTHADAQAVVDYLKSVK